MFLLSCFFTDNTVSFCVRAFSKTPAEVKKGTKKKENKMAEPIRKEGHNNGQTPRRKANFFFFSPKVHNNNQTRKKMTRTAQPEKEKVFTLG